MRAQKTCKNTSLCLNDKKVYMSKIFQTEVAIFEHAKKSSSADNQSSINSIV